MLRHRLQQRVPDFIIGDVLVTWYRQNRRNLPWRELFLKTNDPYLVWVSEVMLQQTTIQAVLPAYQRFLSEFPNLQKLAAADETAVRLASRGLGYYRRFRMLHEAARQLCAQATFVWPQNFAEWRQLPGVGDYTAAAIASIAFNRPKAVVDGNVERVFCRILNLKIIPDAKLKKALQKLGDQIIPQVAPGDYNQAVMELGQTICTKQNPKCEQCPIQTICHAYKEGTQALAPAPRAALDYKDVRLHLLLLHKKGHLGLLQRPASARFLGGTLGLPTAIELGEGELHWEQPGTWTLQNQSIGSFKHSITKHRIEAFVHQREYSAKKNPDLCWVPFAKVESQLLSNLDRKAWVLYQKKYKN